MLLLDYNLWFAKAGDDSITIDWEATEYERFTEYRNGTGQDAHSQFDDPEFVSVTLTSPDLHLTSVSPAIDTGDPALGPSVAGKYYIDGDDRVSGTQIDMGADEYQGTNPHTTTTFFENTTTTTPGITTTTTKEGFCAIREFTAKIQEKQNC
jgi:hypothetical protein